MNVRAQTLRFTLAAAAVAVLAPVTASAQVGIGPRISFVRGTDGPNSGSQRYSGGALRFGSGKTALELALDYRSDLTGDLTARITDYPFQASLLVFPVRGGFSPYLIGGVGWYSQKLQRLSSGGTITLDEETTRKMGYHGGFGAEVRLHRHVGLYGDYRYTFIHFGDDDRATSSTPSLIPFADRLWLSHEGSQFTWGANFYF
jgi:hypothetical protein